MLVCVSLVCHCLALVVCWSCYLLTGYVIVCWHVHIWWAGITCLLTYLASYLDTVMLMYVLAVWLSVDIALVGIVVIGLTLVSLDIGWYLVLVRTFILVLLVYILVICLCVSCH